VKKKINILLVEDEVVSAMFMKKDLLDIGLSICTHVTTGEKALEHTKANQTDLILMDIGLPGSMNGIDTVNAIRQHADIPVIYLTSYQDHFTMNCAQTGKPLGYLIKPVEISVLGQIISQHFPD